MATDFRSGHDFPRRGRTEIEGILWLARVADKARAAAAGTIHDYIYPCPLDRGVFERWGITSAQFETALAAHATDESLAAWLRTVVDAGTIASTNRWVTVEKRASLDRQDAEEGVAV